MMRALFSGVTGLRSHQTRMDVIGNNIANVNTTGYKKSTVTFKDLYSEMVSAASSTSGQGASSTGGVNPMQIGLGSAVSSITTVQTPGAAQYTGNGMDVAISGSGYFTVLTPTGFQYTRSGNFFTDTSGNLVTAGGYYVQTVDAVLKAVQEYTYNSMKTATMLDPNAMDSQGNLIGVTAPSGGVVHSGNITADLADVIGNDYGFQFNGTGWEGVPSGASYTPYIASGDITVTSTTPWTLQNIADAAATKANAMTGVTAGTKALSFVINGTNIDLKCGDVVVDSFDASAGIAAGGSADINFATAGVSVTLKNGGATDVNATAIANALESMANKPSVTLKEGGSWKLVNRTSGQEVEDVKLTCTTGLNAAVAAGELTFSTASLGNISLKVGADVASMSELSHVLRNSTFSADITDGYNVAYSDPGTVLPGELKTRQIDFNKYTSLAIDPKGAIVAQLKEDDQITVDGHVIDRKAGAKVTLGYIPLASFNNPSGLEKAADNMYVTSANSGAATYEMPGSGSVGTLTPSNLEMSNVDLSEEMVNMIITQRGFQANSRIITTTDTMLEELVNLKR